MRAEILSRDAGEKQRRELRYPVVFAIAFTGTECRERRTPYISRAMLRHVAPRLSSEIVGSVDDAESSAALLFVSGFDNAEESSGSGGACAAVVLTCSEHVEVRLHLHRGAPSFPCVTYRDRSSGKAGKGITPRRQSKRKPYCCRRNGVLAAGHEER